MIIYRLYLSSFIFLFFTNLLFGQNYFQQEVNNQIKVELNDSANNLSAHIRIEYINNSPDTLYYIYFHLWPNAYKNNNTAFAKQQLLLRNRDFYFSEPEQRGYIDSLDFSVDNFKAELKETEYADVGLLILPKPLPPKGTVIIETPFYVKIPDSFSRFGHEENSYQVTQWYPKPAVYDKYGWHYMPYLDMGEFYSEFGSFDVSITVPTKYIVAATGNLLTKQELEWLEDLSMDKDRPAPNYGNTGVKTLRYVESNVHDFAWFADKTFRVELDTVILPHSGEYVRCWTFSQKINIVTWRNSVNYVKEAVRFYSEKLGDYPYNNCVAVDGALSAGAGMEYPGITVVSASDKGSLENVIVHEVGHNWFYGILASNERQFPWIDEGFNSFYENRYYDKKFKRELNWTSRLSIDTKFMGLNKLSDNLMLKMPYLYLAKLAVDQKPNLNSEEFSPVNYWVMNYQKPVIGLYQLMLSIGEKNFDNLMRGLYEKYKFKHVYPEDIKDYFNENASQNSDWFFDGIIGSNKKQDYRLGKLKQDSITVKNIGKINAPLLLYFDDNLLLVSEGFSGEKKFFVPKNINEISIDKYQYTTDFSYYKNYHYKNKLFPKLKKTKLELLGIFDYLETYELNILPIIAGNTTHKLMIGASFYNICITPKSFEWYISPLFSPFRANSIHTALAGNTGFNINFAGFSENLKRFSIQTNFNKFAYENNYGNSSNILSWGALNSKLIYTFKQNPTKPYLKTNIIFETVQTLTNQTDLKYFNSLIFSSRNDRIIHPYGVNIQVEQGYGFVKSHIDFDYKLTLYKKNKGIEFRVFAGKFLYNANEYYGNYNFRLAGNLGLQDYKYENIFVGRGEDIRQDAGSFWAHQFMRNEGGFVSYTTCGQSNNWLTSLNVTINTPLPILHVFANVGAWADTQTSFANSQFAYETGLEVRILKDYCSIFFPLTVSNNIKTTNDIYLKKYFERVRFTLNLKLLNPLLHRDKISYLI